MATFTAEVFQNEYLPEGSTEVHAVVSVTCTDAGAAGRTGHGEAAEVILVDTTGSMDMPSTKIVAARKAAQVAIRRDRRRDAGSPWSRATRVTQMLYPDHPSLARMDRGQSRRRPQRRRSGLRSGGSDHHRRLDQLDRASCSQGASASPAPRHPADRRQERGRAAGRPRSGARRGHGRVPVRLPWRRRQTGRSNKLRRIVDRAARDGRHHRRTRRHGGGLRGR